MQDIIEAFEALYMRRCPEATKREIERYIQAGAEAEMIAEAIHYSGGAAVPTWQYAREIIQGNLEAGITSQWEYIQHRKLRRTAAKN